MDAEVAGVSVPLAPAGADVGADICRTARGTPAGQLPRRYAGNRAAAASSGTASALVTNDTM